MVPAHPNSPVVVVEAYPFDRLDHLSSGSGRSVSGIGRSLRLNEKNVRFILGHWTMFNAFGNDEYFTRTQRDGSVAQLNIDASAQDKKEIVGLVVLVPNELALHFDHHEVMSVELADDARLPIIRKCRQLVGQVYGFHDIATMNNRGNGSNTEPSRSAG
jgi:hypothetical protein